MSFKFKVVGLTDKHDCAFLLNNVYETRGEIVFGENNLIFKGWSRNGATFENLQNWFKPWYKLQLLEEIPSENTDDLNDPVNHPSHYTKGKIEVADFIADQKLNFDRGNAVKYVCRAGSKDPSKEIQDLEKAIWYINHEIKMLKGETENGTEKEN